MAQDISLLGAVYPAVPAVKLPKQGGGTATFYDEVGTLAVTSSGTQSVQGYANVSVPAAEINGLFVSGEASISVSSSGLISAGYSDYPAVQVADSAGWVDTSDEMLGTVIISGSQQLSTQAGTTITPTISQQVAVAAGKYTTGAVNVAGDANLVASNIKKNVSIFGVTGNYEGGGGSSGVAAGTLNVPSNVNTSTNTKITDTSTIGFTPKAFLFYRSDRSATSNHINAASFVTLGSSYYIATRTRYSSNALSTSGGTTNWTTQSSGYLYFNSNNVYFRSSSSYILAAGTWYWVAVQ